MEVPVFQKTIGPVTGRLLEVEMLSCQLNRLNGIPLYEQLYSHIKKEIIEGRLSYGTKLPSKRKLSSFLKIGRNTVETAYEQLAAE